MLIAQLAAWRRRSRVVTDSDELNLYRNWPWTSAWWWKPLAKPYEGFFLRRAAANITSDTGRADILQAEYHIRRPVVVLNVPDVFEPAAPNEELRRRYLGPRRYLLIYQGGLVPNRGLPELVRSIQLLPDCALILLGMGHLRDELRELIEAERLADRVALLDAVPWEEMVRITASCDVGVIPIVDSCLSYRYAAPNKLFEDMMAGIPVVASDLPDMARVVREERIGTLIKGTISPESITAAVRELLDGEESLQEVGARGRRAALARYNWEIERKKLLAVYDALASTAGTVALSAGNDAELRGPEPTA
jgi:glycosyltransferase involved in cell wall biosynthesis